MASSAGKLIVEIIATTASFQSDLGKASAAAEAHARKIDRAFAGIKSSIINQLAGVAAAVGGIFTAAGFANLIRGTIDAQEHLLQLSKSTGISVEQLGGLGFAAQQAGGNLDDTALAFRKFSVNAAEALAGSEKQTAVFRALGISLEDIRKLKPDELFVKAAAAFASFEEGPNKAALASAAFGRSYQGILPVLNEGSERLKQNIAYFERFGGVTRETAQRAQDFKDEINKASLLLGAFGRNVTADLLPAMKALVDTFVEAKEKGGGFKDLAQTVADGLVNLAVLAAYAAGNFETLGNSLGAYYAILNRIAHLDFAGVVVISDENRRQVDEIAKKYDALIDKIRNAKKAQEQQAVGPPLPPDFGKRPAPGLPSADADQAARKQLEAALRALDLYIASEQDLLRQRERFLQDYYQSDELGIEDYFRRRAAAQDEALAKQREAFDQEEALIRGRLAKAKPTERADDEKLLADVIGKRAKVEQAAAAESIQAFRAQTLARRAFRDSIEELGIAEAEATGQATAAAARFDFEHRKQVELLKLQLDSEDELLALQARSGLASIESARARFLAQDQLNAATADYGRILGGIEIAQSRIDLAVATGNATEIEGLNARSALVQRYIAILQRATDAAAKAAEGLSGTAKDEALLRVEALRLKIEQLAAETDALGKKFRDVFETDFADALLAFETGAKSLKDTIKDLGKAIENDLLRIANKNIAEQLFGKGGALGGVPDFFAGLFGGKGVLGGAGGAASLGAAGTSLLASSTALDASAAALTAAAGAIVASAGASSAGSIIGGLTGGGFDAIAGFASGGNPPVGMVSLVGERGPELFVPRQSGTIVPHEVLAGRRAARHQINNITINVPAGTSGATADQIAAATMRALRRGQRNL